MGSLSRLFSNQAALCVTHTRGLVRKLAAQSASKRSQKHDGRSQFLRSVRGSLLMYNVEVSQRSYYNYNYSDFCIVEIIPVYTGGRQPPTLLHLPSQGSHEARRLQGALFFLLFTDEEEAALAH